MLETGSSNELGDAQHVVNAVEVEQTPVNKSSRCVEKLRRERNISSRSKSRSLRLSERADARTVRRKDLTMGAHDGNREGTLRRALSVASSTRHADRSVNTSVSAPRSHGQRSSGRCRRPGVPSSVRGALAGVHPGGQSRTREARSHPRPGPQQSGPDQDGQRARRSGADQWRGTAQSSKPHAAREKACHTRANSSPPSTSWNDMRASRRA